MQLDLFRKEEELETERQPAVSNPIMVTLSYNNAVKQWDVLIVIGGFDGEEDARSAAMDLARLMEEEFGAELSDPTDEGTVQ